MAITATDIVFRLSVTTGSAGDTTAGTPAGSLGKYVSTTAITDNTVANLFDNVTGDENAASTVEYRCFFILNNHATITWQAVKVWMPTEVSGGATAAIGLDATATSAKGASAVQAVTIANETTAPSGVTFFAGTAIDTKAEGLTVGDLAPGQVRAIWVRRTAANTGAVDADGLTVRAEGDTTA